MVNQRIATGIAGLMLLCAVSLCEARTVTKVVINGTGLALDDSDPYVQEECRKFVPNKKQVARFFSKAYPVAGRIIHHDRYSPCYAKGTVEFSDHSSGEWWLYSGGTAILEWLSGDKVYLLYKQNRWRDPFACMYGMDPDVPCEDQ